MKTTAAQKAAVAACEKGLRAVAQRAENADRAFVAVLMTAGDICEADAEKVAAYYRKHRITKRDWGGGVVSVTHGAFLDRDVIRKAVTA